MMLGFVERFLTEHRRSAYRWCRRDVLLIGAVVGALLAGPGEAGAQGKELTVHPKSQFWIQGEATTHTFTCSVNEVKGTAHLPADPDSVRTEAVQQQAEVSVMVPVRAFECGNARMTDDLKETLRAEEHPLIRFELVDASVGAASDTSGGWRPVRALGPLTIAGTKRLMRIEAVARALDADHFHLRGCTPIRMTYFGIEPPTKALGLIRVKNRVEVQVDLFAQSASPESDSLFSEVAQKERPSCE